jgi:hypothetical protein
MGKVFRIRIDGFDLGQLLDGLRIRAESWRKTADYLESGFTADDTFICEECDDVEEATKIADHYDRIIALIERQVQEQGGWR